MRDSQKQGEVVKCAEMGTQMERKRARNKVMDMIRTCAAEMQRVLMGSLDSRLHPTNGV